MNEIITQALEKLDKEAKNFKGGSHERAMKDETLDALKHFCKSEQEFAQAVVQKNKTFSDCMSEVAKGVGTSISDLEAYKKAVRFYFPGADIRCTMTINLIGGAAGEAPENGTGENKKSAINISLDELF